MYLAFCSIVIIFNIRLSSVCLMMINVFDRKLTFYFLNTSDGFLRLRPQIHIFKYYNEYNCKSYLRPDEDVDPSKICPVIKSTCTV